MTDPIIDALIDDYVNIFVELSMKNLDAYEVELNKILRGDLCAQKNA